MKYFPVSLEKVSVRNGFWGKRMELARKVIIPLQWKILNDRVRGAEESHAVKNFKIAAGKMKGTFKGCLWQDSDVVKWLEAAAYSLATNPNKELERKIDKLIDLIARCQQKDGYLNTRFTIQDKDKRWCNLCYSHELYCAGHLIEAAVAYCKATNKRKFLDVAIRNADCINKVFGPHKGQRKGYPGHQEVELALVKLYHVTGDKRYLRLAKFFLDQRGQKPNYFETERSGNIVLVSRKEFDDAVRKGGYQYNQSHLPVRLQREVVGHAVRAAYMYCAMVDVGLETADKELIQATKQLWDNLTQKRMYITGGIGSSGSNEGFTVDYDLPNETAYAETCASIGFVFWAHRMLHIEMNGRYSDLMEQVLYNSVLSGMSLDGRLYSYANPLASYPVNGKNSPGSSITSTRQKWFKCACCPPNLLRLLTSLGEYIYSHTENELYLNLYTSSRTKVNLNGRKVVVAQKTDYPWDEKICIDVSPEIESAFTLSLRIPGWCRKVSLKINGRNQKVSEITKKGYARIYRLWKKGDQVELVLSMPIEGVSAQPAVRHNAGRIAIQRGPVVYCLEQIDNGRNLNCVVIPKNTRLKAEFDSRLLGGCVVIKAAAKRHSGDKTRLYGKADDFQAKVVSAKAVPYFLWGNRGEGEMLVWIRET